MNDLATVLVIDDGRADGVVAVALSGELDKLNVGAVRRRLYAAVPNVACGLAIDLAELRYLDSAGIEMLLRLAEDLRIRQQGLRLILPPGALPRRAVELSGTSRLTLCDTLDEARAALTG